MSEKEKPSYYGIIPASVRYDNELPPRAIILYSEITALSNKEKYCFASNGYFAELYDVKSGSISRLLSKLEKGGHLRIEIKRSKKGTTRKIYPLDKKEQGGTQKSLEGITKKSIGLNKKAHHNTKTNNKDNNNSIVDLQKQVRELTAKLELSTQEPKTKRKIFIAPTLEAVKELFAEKGSTNQEAENFYYHYESNGWKVGKNKMQKWRASAGGWIGRNKKSTPQPQQKDLAASYKQHLTHYLNEKQRKSLNGQIEGYLSKCKERGVQSEIDTFKGQMKGVKNKTFTDALIFDVIYGTLQKCGTIPERRFSKFRQWFNKLKDYDKNQKDLRIEFRKHLSK